MTIVHRGNCYFCGEMLGEEFYVDDDDHKCCEMCPDDCRPDDRDFDPYGDGDESLIDGVGFADPGGRSALRAATASNPRNQPCPTCGAENVLTPIDVVHGYQCNACADAAEGVGA